jgi:hypothetical protein
MNCSFLGEDFKQNNLGDDLDQDMDKEIAGMETPEIGSISSAEVSNREVSSPEAEQKSALDLTFDLDDPVPKSPVKTNMAGEKMATPVRELSLKMTATEILEEELKSDELNVSLSSVSTVEERPLSAVMMSSSLPDISPDKPCPVPASSNSVEDLPVNRSSTDVEDLIEKAESASVELAKTAVAQYALLMKEAKLDKVQPVSENKRLSLSLRQKTDDDEEEDSNSVDAAKDGLGAHEGSDEGDDLEMDDMDVDLKKDDDDDAEEPATKMADIIENTMSESMYEEIRKESEAIEEELLHHKQIVDDEGEEVLRMELRQGHVKCERPTSLLSTCSADTGIVADMNSMTTSGAWDKDVGRPVSIVSTSSVDTGTSSYSYSLLLPSCHKIMVVTNALHYAIGSSSL